MKPANSWLKKESDKGYIKKGKKKKRKKESKKGKGMRNLKLLCAYQVLEREEDTWSPNYR